VFGDTVSCLPSRRLGADERFSVDGLVGDVKSLSSFLRPKTFDKNEGIAWLSPRKSEVNESGECNQRGFVFVS
jgi:hypothetical protein